MSPAIGTDEYRDAVNEALVRVDGWLWQLAGRWGPSLHMSADEFRHELTAHIFLKFHNWRPADCALTTWCAFQAKAVASNIARERKQRERVASQDDGAAFILDSTEAPTESGDLDTPPAIDLDKLVSGLRPRHAQALRLRFGLDGAAHTFDQAAQVLKVSKERVRQLVGIGLEKLRAELATG